MQQHEELRQRSLCCSPAPHRRPPYPVIHSGIPPFDVFTCSHHLCRRSSLAAFRQHCEPLEQLPRHYFLSHGPQKLFSRDKTKYILKQSLDALGVCKYMNLDTVVLIVILPEYCYADMIQAWPSHRLLRIGPDSHSARPDSSPHA